MCPLSCKHALCPWQPHEELLLLVCMGILSECLPVNFLGAWCPKGHKRVSDFLKLKFLLTVVSCHMGVRNQNSGPLEEQQEFLTTKPSH